MIYWSDIKNGYLIMRRIIILVTCRLCEPHNHEYENVDVRLIHAVTSNDEFRWFMKRKRGGRELGDRRHICLNDGIALKLFARTAKQTKTQTEKLCMPSSFLFTNRFEYDQNWACCHVEIQATATSYLYSFDLKSPRGHVSSRGTHQKFVLDIAFSFMH